jgi:hypothetical protein
VSGGLRSEAKAREEEEERGSTFEGCFVDAEAG